MNKVTGRFFVPCRRNKETKQPSGLPRLFLRFLYGASLVGAATGFAGRRPRGSRKDGRIGRKQHGFLSDRGGLRIQEKTPHETAAKVSPLRPGSVPEPAPQEPHTPDPQPVRIKEHRQLFRFVSSCSRVQRPGVHRRHRRWQGACPTRYRTDRGKSKKRQVSGRTAKR